MNNGAANMILTLTPIFLNHPHKCDILIRKAREFELCCVCRVEVRGGLTDLSLRVRA